MPLDNEKAHPMPPTFGRREMQAAALPCLLGARA
jgi:hypothetical protein